MNANPNGWHGGTGEHITYLTDDELQRFFAAVAANPISRNRVRDLALFHLILDYGLRAMEIGLVRLKDTHVDEGWVYIRRVKEKHLRTDPKTGEQVRVAKDRRGTSYRLSRTTLPFLKAWLKVREDFQLAESSPYLFITQQTRGKRSEGGFSTNHVYDSVIRYGRVAGIKGIHPHMFRHTTAVKMAKASANSFAIKERLGHTSVMTTEIYVTMFGPDKVAQDEEADKALEF